MAAVHGDTSPRTKQAPEVQWVAKKTSAERDRISGLRAQEQLRQQQVSAAGH